VIEPEMVELLESPCSLLVASVDRDGLPDATRGWGVSVLAGDRVRVLLAANAGRTLANLEGDGRIALTVTHFATLVSWQLKGRARLTEPANAADHIRFDAFCAGCVEVLHALEGTPDEIIWRMVPPGIVACEMEVEQVFDQTPGPSAGAKVAPVGA
jgi:Pyridoxamine 5'-phosphate oxidase